jgi:hypothetical protein
VLAYFALAGMFILGAVSYHMLQDWWMQRTIERFPELQEVDDKVLEMYTDAYLNGLYREDKEKEKNGLRTFVCRVCYRVLYPCDVEPLFESMVPKQLHPRSRNLRGIQ